MKLRPLRDLVVIRCEPLKDETINGVIVLEQFQRVRHGEVLAVGPGFRSKKTGEYTPLDVKPGQRVAFYRENMETQNGQQLKHVIQDLSEYMDADIALIPESAIFGEVTREAKVSS